MNITVAKKLLPLVNTPHFKETLQIYVNEKIQEHYRVLEQSDDFATIHRAQGAITALKKVGQMKEDVQGSSKRD